MKGRTIEDLAIIMAENDTVATALADLKAGQEFDVTAERIRLSEDIEFGHKFSLTAIDTGERIVKYGETIGRATQSIVPGEWVHTHNVASVRARPSKDASKVAGEESNREEKR